jgi:2-polyprenyl-3-methyl-5-hydroxy-6-metoxy-1,4-benzoquinol methylase
MKIEQGADYYDNKKRIPKGLKPTWVNLYNKIIEQIPLNSAVADLGCGPGLFAEFVYEAGYRNYLGLDFSEKCIEAAKQRVPNFTFEVRNLYDPQNIQKYLNYEVFVFVEVLEHIENDLSIINLIPKKKKIIFSVPNRDDAAHVRFFKNAEEVRQRFSSVINFSDVLIIKGGATKKFFVGIGEKS